MKRRYTSMRIIIKKYNDIAYCRSLSSKRLEELGKLLASAYKIDKQKADEMWQSFIEYNSITSDSEYAFKFNKYNYVQVYNKICKYLSDEEAVDFLYMNLERKKSFIKYGYHYYQFWILSLDIWNVLLKEKK